MTEIDDHVRTEELVRLTLMQRRSVHQEKRLQELRDWLHFRNQLQRKQRRQAAMDGLSFRQTLARFIPPMEWLLSVAFTGLSFALLYLIIVQWG